MRRIVVGVGVASVVVAASVFGLTRGGDDDPVRSVEVETDPAFAIDGPVPDHRIVYRVSGSDGGVETDRFVLRGPFESRLETARGEPPGGSTVSVQVGTIDRLAIGGVEEPATVARVPGLAPSSIRVAPVLDAAIEAGLLDVREQRIVAGRRCEVFRSGSTLAAGPLRAISAGEYADTCIDGDGLVLEEALFVDGELAFRRTAVDVEIDPDLDDGDFAVGDPTAPVDQGGGDTSPASPDSAPLGPFHVLPDDRVPEGFRFDGRYSVIPPQPDRFADPTLRDGIVAGVADVYVDGAGDFFVIHQGGTLGRVEAFAPTPGAPDVEVGDLGTGELVLSAQGSEVRVALEGGRFVHVVGPLGPDALVEVGAALVVTEGEGLVLLED